MGKWTLIHVGFAMSLIDEEEAAKTLEALRDLGEAQETLAQMAEALGATRAKPIHTMDICGGHTHSIFRYGLDKLVHEGIEFIHGPGCPVCVLPRARVDECIDLAERPEVIFTQIEEGRAAVENQYARMVPDDGNKVSLAAIDDVYEKRPSFEWRGLGEIDASGLRIRDTYAAFDAEEKFGIGYAGVRKHVPEVGGTA